MCELLEGDELLKGELGTAVESGDGRYRYHLTRDLGEGEGSVAFIMLNPSQANQDRNDHTIERCIGFARSWGRRILEVGNLYARYATDPAGLQNEPDPMGPHNDEYLRVSLLAALRWLWLGEDRGRSFCPPGNSSIGQMTSCG